MNPIIVWTNLGKSSRFDNLLTRVHFAVEWVLFRDVRKQLSFVF